LFAVGGCGAGSNVSEPDAAVEPPPAELPTAWLLDVLETPRLRNGVTVTGGFVVVGNAEVFRFTDDGILDVRRALPDRWGSVHAVGTPAGNVLVAVDALDPAEELLVELDGVTLEEHWTYVVDPAAWPTTAAIGLRDGRTIAVTRTELPPWIHAAHAIDGEGIGGETPLGVPAGVGGSWFERSDGKLSGTHDRNGECRYWTLDPDTQESTFDPIGDALCEGSNSVETSGVQVVSYPRYADPTVHALTVVDRDGRVLAQSKTMPHSLAPRGALVTERLILGVAAGGHAYVAHLDDLDAMEELVLPYRPGGSTDDAVMASDGVRTFVAWLDQVSTFDTVLRVARVGEIE